MHSPSAPDDAQAPSAADLCRLAAGGLGVQRASLWRWEEGAEHLEREHLYDAALDRGRAGGRLRRSDVPRIWEAPDEVEVRALADVAADGSPYRDLQPIYFGPVGIRSLLQVPIRTPPDTLHLLWLEHTGSRREWSDRDRREAEALAEWWRSGRGASPPSGDRGDDSVSLALRRAAAETSLGVFLSDGERVTAGSRAFCSLLGLEPEDLAEGRALGSFLPEDVAEGLVSEAGGGAGSGPRTVPIRRPDGEIRWGLLEIAAADREEGGGDGSAPVAGWVVDVTPLKDREQELAELAYSDPLTGLANRRLLHEQGERAVALAARHDRSLALLYLDLSGFKRVNDAYGHAAGDDVLVEVAARMQEQFRTSDVVARIGGDEFAVLLAEVDDRPGAVEAAERLIERIGEPIPVGETSVRLTGAVGIALAPRHADRFSGLLKAADQAMYEAKREPGLRVRVRGDRREPGDEPGDESGDESSDPDPEVTPDDVRSALERDRLSLHYQPVFPARSGRPVGAEALLRLRGAGSTLLPASEFVPVAEESHAIGRFDLWVVRQVVRWTRSEGRDFPGWVSANLSSWTVAESRLVRLLAEECRSAEVAGRTVCLEVPWPGSTGESGGEGSARRLQERLSPLQEAGFRVFAELTSAEPTALAELSELSPSRVKVPQVLLRELERRTGRSVEHVLAWMQAGWECPLTVSRLDDPRLREELEGIDLDLHVQGRELCPPVEARDLPARAGAR